MKYPHIRLVVLVLGLALIAPVSLFVVPESAHAIPVEVSVDPFEVADTIQNTITAVATPVSAAANLAKQISDYVLQPIAFIKSGMLLKTLTAGVVSFVTGATNGTGAPQFVQNLQGNLQRVGDTQALAFFAQFASNSNSPFSSSIVSALRMNYLQQTSAAGFWAANRSTLSRYSPNVNSFLAGNWSQGGVGAWLALTTQPQNNPYLMYQMSQGQLGTMVAGAVNARQSQLAWGQGFLSWCGPAAEVEGPPAGACTPQSNDGDGCTTDAGVPGTCSISPENPQNVQCVPKVGVNPGDSCYQSDGTPGQIRTPGSVIAASLNKALGGGQDKLVQMGNIGTQLGKILSDIATIMGTINLANDILSGPSFDGLAGASRSPAFSSTNNPANTAITTINNQTASITNGSLAGRLDQYQKGWNKIKAAVDTASSTLNTIISTCSQQTGSAQAGAAIMSAQTALSSVVAPAYSEVLAADAVIAQAQSLMNSAATDSTTRPTFDDMTYAVQQSAATGNARANPDGSLNVYGGTMLDRMNLVSANAAQLQAACYPNANVPSGG